MTEEILNSDGSRNWQANILLDNVKRLELENKGLKETVEDLNQSIQNCNIQRTKMYKALEEIRVIINQPCNNCKYNKDNTTCSIGDCGEGKLQIIQTKINEVLNA